MSLPVPQLLVFDVFGTVVDWHASVTQAVAAAGLGVDAADFAREWRAGYQPAMDPVRRRERPFVLLDVLHREILDALLTRHGLMLEAARRAELTRAWHRLDPWPEAVAGLTRLARRFTIATLSNGNLGMLANMAKRAGLPWDCVLGAEVFRAYKPDPAMYLGAANVFALEPAQVLMVAAHHDDLAAARRCGLQTAYVERPLEFGAGHEKDVSPRAGNTYHARDFLDLAGQLDC